MSRKSSSRYIICCTLLEHCSFFISRSWFSKRTGHCDFYIYLLSVCWRVGGGTWQKPDNHDVCRTDYKTGYGAIIKPDMWRYKTEMDENTGLCHPRLRFWYRCICVWLHYSPLKHKTNSLSRRHNCFSIFIILVFIYD